MKQRARLRRKPLSEERQLEIACGTFIAALFLGIWLVSRFVPMAPLPDTLTKHYSLQEIRR